MPFHLLGYRAALGINAADTDLVALVDPEFSRRGGAGAADHYIFTEPYRLAMAHYMAASATRARFNVPSINAIGRQQIWPVNRSATIQSHERVMDLRDSPLDLPMNEEVAIEGSNNLGAATEESSAMLWVVPPGWNMNIPTGLRRLTVRATGAVAGTAASWGAAGAITFSENLTGGYYSVVGCRVFDAGTLAFRLIFPRGNVVNGRRLRPGGLSSEAIGDLPFDYQMEDFGLWGAFHSFEPPQMEIWANATAASVQEIRMDLIYHGSSNPGLPGY